MFDILHKKITELRNNPNIKQVEAEYPEGYYEALNDVEDILDELPFPEIEKAVDEKIEDCVVDMPHGEFTHESECIKHENWLRSQLWYFYNLGRQTKMMESN